MEQENKAIAFSFDKVCTPCGLGYLLLVFVQSREAFGKRLERFQALRIYYKVVDQFTIKLCIREVADVQFFYQI